MSPTLTIVRRELKSSFDTPMPYVVLCLGLPVLAWYFFAVFEGGFWQANRASMTNLVMLDARLVAIFSAVLTMRVMADERRTGTLEMLITLPLRDHQVILGKFLGTWLVVLAALGVTLLFPVMMFVWPWKLGVLDWGPVLSGYLGLLLSSAASVSIGMLISSLTESQTVAFVITLVVLGLLHVSGDAVQSVETPTRFWQVFRSTVDFISFDTRLASLARGLITTRDILYFASIPIICLMASFAALERRKWS